MNSELEWVIAAEAPARPIAESWLELLHQAGIPCRIPPREISEIIGGDFMSVVVEVPSDRIDEARELLGEPVSLSDGEEVDEDGD